MSHDFEFRNDRIMAYIFSTEVLKINFFCNRM